MRRGMKKRRPKPPFSDEEKGLRSVSLAACCRRLLPPPAAVASNRGPLQPSRCPLQPWLAQPSLPAARGGAYSLVSPPSAEPDPVEM